MNNNAVRYNDPTRHVCSDPEDPTPGCDGGTRYKERRLPLNQSPANNQACTGQNQSVLCVPTPIFSSDPVFSTVPTLTPIPGPGYYPASDMDQYPSCDSSPYIYVDWDTVDRIDLAIDIIGIGGDVVAGASLYVGAAPVAAVAEIVTMSVEIFGFAKSGLELLQGNPNSAIKDLSENQIKVVMISRFGRVIPGFGVVLNGVSIWANLRPEIRNP